MTGMQANKVTNLLNWFKERGIEYDNIHIITDRYAYLQSLPPREYLPMFWSQEEQELLRGTDAADRPDADRMDTAADFDTEVVPLLSQGGAYFDKSKMTLERFRVAASWIGSRAFGVDDYHGMALVPFADIFNHKASIVSLSGSYELEGACMEHAGTSEEEDEEIVDISDCMGGEGDDKEGKDEPAAGSSGDDAEDQEDGKVGSSESEDLGDWEPPGRPAISAVSRGSMLNAALFPDLDLRLHIGICGAQRNGQEVLEIIAACPLSKGQEVFNTFGELDNCELVCKYGFALPDNPFSNVRLNKDVVLEMASGLLGSEECQRRREYLEEQSDLLDEGEEPFLVLPKAQVGPSLLVAARILSAPPMEFAAFRDSDLTEALKWLRSPEEEVPQLVDIEQPRKRRRMEAEVAEGDKKAEVENPAEENEAEATAEVENAVPGNTPIDKSLTWFPASICALLTACLEERWRRCAHLGIEADKTLLAAAASVRPRSESHCAKIAALTLVLSEKAILQEALAALQERVDSDQ